MIDTTWRSRLKTARIAGQNDQACTNFKRLLNAAADKQPSTYINLPGTAKSVALKVNDSRFNWMFSPYEIAKGLNK